MQYSNTGFSVGTIPVVIRSIGSHTNDLFKQPIVTDNGYKLQQIVETTIGVSWGLNVQRLGSQRSLRMCTKHTLTRVSWGQCPL